MKSFGTLALIMAILSVSPGNSFAQTNLPPHSARHIRPVNMPLNPGLPSLFLIGDSTVRNGQGTGTGGQWGWGDFLAPYFNTNKINVVNRALGGTSSRTFYRDQWPAVLAIVKPGDFVIMQFGTNDGGSLNDTNRARGSIKGVGDESRSFTNLLTHQAEIVHTFGWYEKTIVNETRAKGAVPMICSLIPRNNWKDGNVLRNKADYGGWAGEAAANANAPFLDINDIIADAYDHLGQDAVKPLFVAGAGPHTSLAGAQTNAMCVILALKEIKTNPLAPYYSDKAKLVSAR